MRVRDKTAGRYGENILASLVPRPANSGTRHGSNNSRLHALEEPSIPLPLMQQLAPLHKPINIPQRRIARRPPRLQHRLHNIHRRRERRREATRHRASSAVRDGVVHLLGVHGGGNRFVGQELEGREGHGHGERGGVGDVEGAQAFGAEDVARAVGHGAEELLGAVDLHALLDNCGVLVRLAPGKLGRGVTIKGVHEGVAGDGGTGAAGSSCEGVVETRLVAAH